MNEKQGRMTIGYQKYQKAEIEVKADTALAAGEQR